ncbi:Forkhead-associated (FHA) domain [Arabidopsis thaliana x Arabidopsis arenosa]|uniref:Forkhead-associated (FHA) domain n=1 Tax=Arabidopsis thaliana x Arabidopsis arenosa TaxID=1240361 RepID=A0A8T1XKT7_9BRAS|nr:Forkhead-associated (FHA) domain [Arabidopsis thaliana x Arabidopsis arenosa]
MYGRRSGLDRFKKSETSEPFSVSANPPPATALSGKTQIGAGQSNWHPPDWAIEPRAGVYSLEVVKDGQILDRIHLDRRSHIFGRQHQTCDFVLDHQSVSRQHAAVVPHKNGSIFVIDLGSAHGTFVANERLTKDTPVELEVGQSLRFAASTRIYLLRKNSEALFSRPQIKLPPPPDASDEEALVAYNTLLNRYGLSDGESGCVLGKRKEKAGSEAGVAKRMKKVRVSFRDQLGGELAEIVGMSDGADVETEPGPINVKEGSLVGKYESLVQVTLIPKGKVKEEKAFTGTRGVTDRLQEAMNMLKGGPKRGIYDDLYGGDSLAKAVGTSWASVSEPPSKVKEEIECRGVGEEDDNDDLFGV